MRIDTASPKAFFPGGLSPEMFFSRDMGLTCHALRARGVDSQVILLDGPQAQAHPDIRRASFAELTSADWWRARGADAVVLCAWAAPRYTPVAQAIKDGGARLIERCDCGEPFSQRQKTLRAAFRTHYLAARYNGKPWWRSVVFSALKTPLFYVPALYDRRVVERLALADAIWIESPAAARAWKAGLARYGRPDVAERVRYVPHPIRIAEAWDEIGPRPARILAVGRWDHYQKNAPLLIRALGRALAETPQYEAHLFGAGEDRLRRLARRLPESVRSRVVIRGRADHADLLREGRRSRIFFAPSRSESFSLAAAEALSGGCSLVGSGHILPFQHFVSRNSGTLARRYTANSMAEALQAEIRAWEDGRRDPVAIRTAWQPEFSAAAIADAALSVG